MSMWICPACEYVNDELATECRRCGAQSPQSALPAESEAKQLGAAGESPSAAAMGARTADELLAAEVSREKELRGGMPTRAGEPPRRSGDKLALGLILTALAALLAVGYVAYARGYLDNALGRSSSPKTPPLVVNVADSSDALNLAGEDPLLALERDIAGIRPYRRFADVLREVETELAETRVEADGPNALSEASRQRLYELEPLGHRLLKEYQDFEARVLRDRSDDLEPYQDMLRGQFIQRMDAMIAVLGQAYALQDGLNHQAFLLSDALPDAVAAAGRADAEPLRERWLDAVHSREQLVLDSQFDDEIQQLTARVELLRELHNDYNRIFQSSPQYRIRGGYPNQVALDLLGHYDEMALKIEELVLEHQEYVATLPADHRSETVRELIAAFTDLAQVDHFYAFSETYSIYEQDRNLDHPAYPKLRERLEFVRAHWPSNAGRYQLVYEGAEQRWADRFAR